MKKKKAVSDGYLDKLWSKAVKRNTTCWKCGRLCHQAHHIVKRRYRVTRWNVKNGIPLCFDCHQWVHTTLEGKEWEMSTEHVAYLKTCQENLKDYLMRARISDNEFRLQKAAELKEIISEL